MDVAHTFSCIVLSRHTYRYIRLVKS